MPKAIRASLSQGQYRSSPITISNGSASSHQQHHQNQQQYFRTIATAMQANLGAQSMNHMHPHPHSLPSFTTNPPMQQPSSSQYVSQPPAIPISTRPSSGAWTPSDDMALMTARAQGQNWAQVQIRCFPNKTANACRKRHERLMDRRNSDDWDAIKLETLGKEYMAMRREIWSALAERTGEKWSVVEAKVLGSGLKNLQSAARASSRRARLSASHDPLDPHNASYTDDSAIGIEDLDGDYNDSPDPDCTYDQSHQQHQMQMMGAQLGSQQHQMMREQQQQQHHHLEHTRQYVAAGQRIQGRGGHGHSQSLSNISNGGRDMGIGSIINGGGPSGV